MGPIGPDVQQDPQVAPDQQPSPPQVFAAHKMMGLSDLDAAMKTRDYLRHQADARGSFRNAQDLIVGLGKTPLTGDALQKQLYEQADQPMQDAQMKAQVRYGQALADPSHPTNRAFQALVKQHLPGVPADNLTVYDAEQLGGPMKMLSDYAKQMGEAASSQATAGKTVITAVPEANKLSAEAGKTSAEASQIAPNAAAERKLKTAEAGKTSALTGPEAAKATAEAGKAGAEAAHTRMLTSGEVAPGYSRGSIPIDEPEAKKINDSYEDLIKGKRSIGEILNILGDKDFVANPNTRAKLAPRIGLLMGELRASSGVRQVAGPELHFLEQIVPDPNNVSLKNVLGLAQNATRLRELSKKLDEGWQSTVKAKGLVKSGGAPQAATTSTAPTHYLVSPDGKSRIPAGADGKPLPGAKPEKVPNA